MFRSAVAEFAELEVRPRVQANGAGGSDRSGTHSAVFLAGPHGHRSARAIRRRGRVAHHGRRSRSKPSAAWTPPRRSWSTCRTRSSTTRSPATGATSIKSRYLPRLTSESVGAYALSEPGSGSDAFGAPDHRPTRSGSHFVLNGRKMWITNGAEADVFVVFANVDRAAGYKGITAFIIERDFPGFRVGKKEDKLGIRASSTVELMLDGCEVPAANVLGPVGQGYQDRDRDAQRGPDRDRGPDDRRRRWRAGGRDGVHQGAASNSASRCPIFRPYSSRSRKPRRSSRRPGSWCTTRRASRTRVTTSRAKARWPSSSRLRSAERVTSRVPRALRRLWLHDRLPGRRSSTATPRSARSTRARRTCSCRRSPRRCCDDEHRQPRLNTSSAAGPGAMDSARGSPDARRSFGATASSDGVCPPARCPAFYHVMRVRSLGPSMPWSMTAVRPLWGSIVGLVGMCGVVGYLLGAWLWDFCEARFGQ